MKENNCPANKKEKKMQIKSWFQQFLIGKEILQLEERGVLFSEIFNQIIKKKVMMIK